MSAAGPIVDAAVWVSPANDGDLLAHLPATWARHVESFGGRAMPPADGAIGTLEDLRRKHLEPLEIERAILTPVTAAGRQYNQELDAALARAVNDWQVANWLDRESRLRASIVISPEWPEAAAEEVERRATDPRFAQVLLAGRTRSPLGDQRYWPIYSAAERRSLPIAIWPRGFAWFPSTGAGWPSTPLEDQLGAGPAMQATIGSLVFNAAFERFPSLRILCIDAGYDWVQPLSWRLDGCWKMLKDEVPELRRLPSEYVQESVYLGSPEAPRTGDAAGRVLFASGSTGSGARPFASATVDALYARLGSG